MPYRFFIWLAYIFVGFSFIFGLASLDPNSGIGTNSDLEAVMEFNLLRAREVLGFDYYLPNPSFFSGLADLLLWDYPVFEGNWGYIRTFFLYPLSLIASLIIVITITPVILSAISTVRNLFRT